MKRHSARAIIFREDKILLMNRHKNSLSYYTLIGGQIEDNETSAEALVREVFEETSLKISKYRLVFIEGQNEGFGVQEIYLCEDPGGVVKLQPSSIEAKLNKKGKNTFTPIWVDKAELSNIPLKSLKVKQAIINAVKNTFSLDVIEL